MKILILLSIILISSSFRVLSQTEKKLDDTGRRIFSKAETLAYLEKRTGPFIHLSDGSIFTMRRYTCEISKDQGKTWTEYPLVDPGKYSLGSPYCLRTKKGTIIVGFSNGKEQSPLKWDNTTHCYDPNAKIPTYITYSRDNGKTWSKPHKLHDVWTGMNRGMIETKDGHVVFSTMIMRNNPGRHCVVTYVSSDDGVTWTQSNVLDSPSSAGHHAGIMEADIIELKNGRLWMLIRTNWDYFYESFSSDKGLTWSAYDKTNIDASSAPGALLRLQSGRIVLVWNRLCRNGENEIKRSGGDSNLSGEAASWQRDELSLMYSDDDTKTWSAPMVIAENETPTGLTKDWISYPHIFEPTKGTIWVTTEFSNPVRIAIKEKDLHK